MTPNVLVPNVVPGASASGSVRAVFLNVNAAGCENTEILKYCFSRFSIGPQVRYQRPDPALGAAGPPPHLIRRQDRFLRQVLLQLLHRLLHQPPRQPANDRPVGDQRRQLRAEFSSDLLSQWRPRRVFAVPTNHNWEAGIR